MLHALVYVLLFAFPIECVCVRTVYAAVSTVRLPPSHIHGLKTQQEHQRQWVCACIRKTIVEGARIAWRETFYRLCSAALLLRKRLHLMRVLEVRTACLHHLHRVRIQLQ